MNETVQPDEELARLESMHERVEKLRSKLKDIELTSHSLAAKEATGTSESTVGQDPGSKNYA